MCVADVQTEAVRNRTICHTHTSEDIWNTLNAYILLHVLFLVNGATLYG